MAAQIEHLEHNMVKVTVKVSKEDFAEAMQKAFRKNAKHFAIPGFRKGKAPMNMVLNYYGEAVLYDDALDFVAQSTYDAALKELDVEPYSQSSFDVEEIGLDKGVVYHSTFALKPEVKLADYKGVVAYKPEAKVTDEEVDQEITRAREQVARLVPVEGRPVEEGDTVVIDYLGKKDGEAFEGGKAEGYELAIGSHSFIPGFEEAIVGHEAGEEFDIDLKFPEEYHSKDLAGQAVVFEIKLHEIKKREVPELNDEFVMDVTEDCNTVEEYKAHIKEEISERKEKHAQDEFANNVFQKVVDSAEMDLPHVLIHEEMERMYNDQARQMQAQGFSMEQYMKMLNLTKESLLQQLHAPAETRVRRDLVIGKIIELEDISVSDEERDAKIKEYSDAYRMDFDKMKESMSNPGMQEMIDNEIKQHKAFDLVIDSAVATDQKPFDEEKEEDHEHGPNCDCGHDHDHEETKEDTAE